MWLGNGYQFTIFVHDLIRNCNCDFKVAASHEDTGIIKLPLNSLENSYALR